jgi:hypothetical protein
MRHFNLMFRCGVHIGIILILLDPLCVSYAGDDKLENAKVEIEKLTLFKNGLGFVVSTATLPDDAKTIRIGQLPIPAFGTFWVGYPQNVKLQNLVTSVEESERIIPAQNLAQLLQANVGRKVLVHTSDRDIEGTIIAKPAEPVPQKMPSPYFMGPRQSRDPYGRLVPETPSGDVLTLKTEKGIVVLSQGSVLRAEFKDGDPATTINCKLRYPGIKIQLDKPAGGEKVSISYLARGITWVPGYLVDLSDPKTARFSAHAKIINEMTDFNEVELQLATGFPNIKFGEILDPVAKSQTLAEFLGALSNPSPRQSGSSYMMNQAIVAQAEGYDEAEISVSPTYSTAAEGVVAEDLFFYPIKNFTLKNNETSWLPLFTAEMPYRHVYTWKIQDLLDKEDHYQSQGETQDRKSAEEVWHSCRLVNTLAMPLTTAATEFMTNGEFTGQDVCYYTAPKAETTIRINKALNLLAEQAEVEVERKRDAMRIHGYNYDLVTVRGELIIRNKIGKMVTVEITKELSGEVIESTPKCSDVKTAKGLKQVNPKHILKWEVQLKSKGEETMSYQYKVYIRE